MNGASGRKNDHVRLAEQLRPRVAAAPSAFDELRFVHHSLCGIGVGDVNLGVTVCSARWSVPFYINAMTGGSEHTGRINAALARAAQHAGVAIASGSEHVALRNPALAGTFATIREHTSGFVFANVGPTVTVEQAHRAVQLVKANALQVHLNLAQELVMPEGDRNFSGWEESIRAIVSDSEVPVVVKEVGFGMSDLTVARLAALGVTTVDVSGRGGTNFIDIENHRRDRSEYAYLNTWGQSAPLCLLSVLHGPVCQASDAVDVLASGGVRNPLDVVKALALGATAVGVSGHFLHTLLAEGEQTLFDELDSWKRQLRSLFCLLGAKSAADLAHTDLLVTGRTREEAELLGVDVGALARRSSSGDGRGDGRGLSESSFAG